MLTIIHGDDTDKSYETFTLLRERVKDKEIRVLDGKGLTTTALTEALESSSLFGNDVSVVITKLLSSVNKKSSGWLELVDIINASANTADILLYEPKELDKTTLSKFTQDALIQTYIIPKIIWEFMDGLHTGNTQSSLMKFQKIIAHDPVEIVFAMIIKRFRHLIQLSDGITPDGVAPWQAARLTRQARFFTMEKLVALYKKLAAIELSLKTGGSPFTLSQHIEQYIISL